MINARNALHHDPLQDVAFGLRSTFALQYLSKVFHIPTRERRRKEKACERERECVCVCVSPVFRQERGKGREQKANQSVSGQ
jgi:hypothetical protein